MTVTIHKVTGGEGYDYLTEQVASGDDRRARTSIEDYYERTGELAGYWLGAGAEARGLDGTVRSEVMRDLWVAAAIRNQARNGVAGFDFTMSPVKSVSALWAVAPRDLQARIEGAHRAAVAATVGYLEGFAATRTGRGGRPERAPGLVVAAFEHRVSRTGDPDLHTHAAVLNRAQSPDGQWRALLHLPLYEATVAASEFYNARLEDHLVRDLGVAFEDRPRANAELRPTREIVGVPAELMREFSGRRQLIEARVAALAENHGLNHQRSVRSAARVHQWATLDTRGRKGPPMSLAQRVVRWRERAERLLGVGGVERVLAAVRRAVHRLDPRSLADVARDVRARALQARPRPRPLHYRAEAERQLRAHPAAIADRDQVVATMTETVMTMAEPTVTRQQARMLELARQGARRRHAREPSREHQAVAAAAEYYQAAAAESWVPAYMATRQLPSRDVGYAAGHGYLMRHLRGLGFTDDEMLRAGLAGRTDRGRMFDWFQDRAVFPLREPSGQIVGFTARRSPAVEVGPKYLNSPGETRTGMDLFRKREVLYGLTPEAVDRLRAGAPVVFVEGPTDALAFDVSRETSRTQLNDDRGNLSSAQRLLDTRTRLDPNRRDWIEDAQADVITYEERIASRLPLVDAVVVGTCGTALTRDHLTTLDRVAPMADRAVYVVFDNDGPGVRAQLAAYRTFREFGLTDLHTMSLAGDPADALRRIGPDAVAATWAEFSVPLYDAPVYDVLDKWADEEGEFHWPEKKLGALAELAPIIAAMPAEHRERQILVVASETRLQAGLVRARIQAQVPAGERLDLPVRPMVGQQRVGYSQVGPQRPVEAPHLSY